MTYLRFSVRAMSMIPAYPVFDDESPSSSLLSAPAVRVWVGGWVGVGVSVCVVWSSTFFCFVQNS